MNNCLITRLKGSVDNDSLLKIGELRLKASKVELAKSEGSSLDYICHQGGIYSDSDKKKPITHSGIESNSVTIYADSDSIFSILPKYNLTELYLTGLDSVSGGLSSFNIKGLRNLDIKGNIEDDVENLNKDIVALFITQAPNIKMSLDSISKFKNLTYLTLKSPSQLVGDISRLGSLINLTNLNIDENTGISGTLESFVQAQRQYGRKTNSTGILCGYLAGTQITFNNEQLVTLYDKKLVWTETTITLSNTNGESAVTVNA